MYEPKTGVELATDAILEAARKARRASKLDFPATVRAMTYALEKLNREQLDVQDGKAAA